MVYKLVSVEFDHEYTFGENDALMRNYKLGLHTGEADVNYNQLAGKQAPSIGDSIDGELSKNSFGWVLKRNGPMSAARNGTPPTMDASAQLDRIVTMLENITTILSKWQ